MTTKDLNRRQVRWAELLAIFDFKIHHRKGSDNAAADALSRRSDYMAKEKRTYDTLLRKKSDGTVVYNHPQVAAVRIANKNQWTQRIEQRKDGLRIVKGRIYVPEELREELVKDNHEAKAHGHQGVDHTIDRIRRHY